MDGSHNHGVAWVSIDDWIAARTVMELNPRATRASGMMTPASQDEILTMRRRKSGPGVSHHAVMPPHLRHRNTA